MRKAKLTIVTELQSMLAKLAGKLPTHLSLAVGNNKASGRSISSSCEIM